MAFAMTGQRGQAETRDVRLAMEDIGVIAKGRLVSRKRLRRILRQRRGEWEEQDGENEGEEDLDPDGEDETDESTESLEKLLNWFKGPQAAECRRVAGVASSASGALANGVVTGGLAEMNHRPAYVAEYVTSMVTSMIRLMKGLIQKELAKTNGIENGVGASDGVHDGISYYIES